MADVDPRSRYAQDGGAGAAARQQHTPGSASRDSPARPSSQPHQHPHHQHQAYSSYRQSSPGGDYDSQHPQRRGTPSRSAAEQHVSPSDTGSHGVSPHDGTDTSPGAHDQEDSDKPRIRACDACRALKVRCDQFLDENPPTCKRCKKHGRECIISPPTRRRQRKADSKIADLERMVFAMQQQLEGKSAEAAMNGHVPLNEGKSAGELIPLTPPPPVHATLPQRTASPGGAVLAKRRRIEDTAAPVTLDRAGPGQKAVLDDKAEQYADIQAMLAPIVSRETANRIFYNYVEDVVPHLPIIAFPSNVNADEFQMKNPTLYFAIVSAACVGIVSHEKQMELSELIVRWLERGSFTDKSIERMQALMASSFWYRPPETRFPTNFWLLSHNAALMGMDLGLGRRYNPSRARNPRHGLIYPNSDTIECRRTWLSTYFLCACTSMILRRPNLVRWTPYVEECVEELQTSGDALPSDRLLVEYAKVQHICEEIGTQFSMDDPSATVGINDPKIVFAIQRFEKDLKQWRSAVPKGVMVPALEMAHHVANLYLHEIAMHVDHNIDDFRVPVTEESLKGGSGEFDKFTPMQIHALQECFTASQAIIEIFLQNGLDMIGRLPLFLYFVRLIYAVIILIKIHFSISAPKSTLGNIISQDDLKVEYYIDKLLALFHTAQDQNAYRPQRRIIGILGKVREWFIKYKDNRPGDGSPVTARHDEARPPTQMTPSSYAHSSSAHASTPLHVLSDAATTMTGNSSASHSLSNTPYGAHHPTTMSGGDTSQPPAPYDNGMGTLGFDMTGFDMSSAPGVFGWDMGMQQAMDMTLGQDAGGFGGLFMPDGLTYSPEMTESTHPHLPPGQGQGHGHGHGHGHGQHAGQHHPSGHRPSHAGQAHPAVAAAMGYGTGWQ